MPGCKALSDTEIQATLNHLPNLRDRCLFLFLFRTGFRISEALSLKVSDVTQYGTIRTHITVTKSNMKGSKASRSVKLHPEAIQTIEQLIRMHVLTPADPLFKSRNGAAITRIQAYRVIKRAFLAAEITGKTGTHCGRKSLASRVYEASGRDLVKTQKALGHISINSTISYLNTDSAEIDELISKLS